MFMLKTYLLQQLDEFTFQILIVHLTENSSKLFLLFLEGLCEDLPALPTLFPFAYPSLPKPVCIVLHFRL